MKGMAGIGPTASSAWARAAKAAKEKASWLPGIRNINHKEGESFFRSTCATRSNSAPGSSKPSESSKVPLTNVYPRSSTGSTSSRDSRGSIQSVEEFSGTPKQEKMQISQDALPHTGFEVYQSIGTPLLPHQSKFFSGGPPPLYRTPSISSQSSLESSVSRQGHRGSSPQIRTTAPDGRSKVLPHQETIYSGSYPPHSSSRSTSPLRAASLDRRCHSPEIPNLSNIHLRTPSPSQSSLTSLAGSASPSSSPRNLGRCPSPLLLPPKLHAPDTATSYVPPSPLGTIQPDLYTRREGPISLSLDQGISLGKLHFKMKYDFDKSDLNVYLIEAIELTSSDCGGFNDPYVKLFLLPEVDNKQRQTLIHHNQSNPYFDHNFTFPVSYDDLQCKSLVIQVYDFDRQSQNDIIGEVRLNMHDFDVTSNVEVWADISKHKKPADEKQEILISLSYLPSAERLTVTLLKARNLFLPTGRKTVDSYVKLYLEVGGKRMKKKKTATKKNTRNPVWNEAFTFDLTPDILSQTFIELSIFNQINELMTSDVMIGSCLLGPHETGSSGDHWQDMLDSPRKAVAYWHTLRSVE